jgi:hypothetical protein
MVRKYNEASIALRLDFMMRHYGLDLADFPRAKEYNLTFAVPIGEKSL